MSYYELKFLYLDLLLKNWKITVFNFNKNKEEFEIVSVPVLKLLDFHNLEYRWPFNLEFKVN
jgi:hypothetical protein